MMRTIAMLLLQMMMILLLLLLAFHGSGDDSRMRNVHGHSAIRRTRPT